MQGSLMQEVEKWKQMTEDHKMNYNALTQSMAAANRKFFSNIKHMSKTLLTIPIRSCSCKRSFSAETPHDLAEDRNFAKPAQWPDVTIYIEVLM